MGYHDAIPAISNGSGVIGIPCGTTAYASYNPYVKVTCHGPAWCDVFNIFTGAVCGIGYCAGYTIGAITPGVLFCQPEFNPGVCSKGYEFIYDVCGIRIQ